MYNHIIKELTDRLIGLLLFLIAAPILLILMLIIKLESRGPAIYKQVRTGKNGKDFTIYKLRSMYYNLNNSGAHFTTTDDLRITKIGKFIRLTSLDELPQAFNLLLGDMSFIGPRADLPVQKDNYTPEEWTLRHLIKPGITGLAQALRRSQCTPKQRKRLDLFYVKKLNCFLDLYIVYKTFDVVFKRGAQN
jgi:lipopolysaccharide/colanic/teichoic acid biosynthesis glycosyltransferase